MSTLNAGSRRGAGVSATEIRGPLLLADEDPTCTSWQRSAKKYNLARIPMAISAR
jgi:hypothetical protein